MEIYGIASTEDVDRTGERVHLKGMDVADIRLWVDEHQSDTMFQILGKISQCTKIFSIKDCVDEYQLKCWNLVKRPYLYVRGALANDEGHPNAAAAAALIQFSVKNPDFAVGFSIEGSTIHREGPELIQTKVKNVALTVRPANPHTCIFPIMDLAKSFTTPELPECYKGVEGRKQFRNIPTVEQKILAKSEFIKDIKDLAKSDAETMDSAAVIKCWNCGQNKLFMKSRLPNRCSACSEAFTMSDIFKARSSKSIF